MEFQTDINDSPKIQNLPLHKTGQILNWYNNINSVFEI